MEIEAVVDRVTFHRNGRVDVQLQIEPKEGAENTIRGNITVNAKKDPGYKIGDTIKFKESK